MVLCRAAHLDHAVELSASLPAMENVTSSAACFQHAVFPDTRAGSRRVLDLAAPGPGRLVAARDLVRRRPGRGILPATDSPTPGTAEHGNFEERSFVQWIFSGAGLDASLYRPESLRRRVPAGAASHFGPRSPAGTPGEPDPPPRRPVNLADRRHLLLSRLGRLLDAGEPHPAHHRGQARRAPRLECRVLGRAGALLARHCPRRIRTPGPIPPARHR